jgi:alkylhydroperoxidase family enzyme
MELAIHTSESAPGDAAEILSAIAADLGLVPNLAASAAASPALLRGFDGLRRAVAGGTLDPVAREVAGLAVGVAVDNRYGVAFHSTMLGGLGLEGRDVAALRAGGDPAEPRLAAIAQLARTIIHGRGKGADGAIAAALAAGWTEEDVLEVVAECTFAGLVGVIDNLAGHVALDEFLQPQAWSPDAVAA